MKDLDLFDIITIILVAGKVFGYLNISWVACFAPLWVPFLIVVWLALLAWNWVVCLVVTLLAMSAFGVN